MHFKISLFFGFNDENYICNHKTKNHSSLKQQLKKNPIYSVPGDPNLPVRNMVFLGTVFKHHLFKNKEICTPLIGRHQHPALLEAVNPQSQNQESPKGCILVASQQQYTGDSPGTKNLLFSTFIRFDSMKATFSLCSVYS